MKRIIVILINVLFSLSIYAQVTFQKTYGGALDDIAYSVQPLSNGEFIIAGWNQPDSGITGRAYLAKVDSLGNIIWTKVYGPLFAYILPYYVQQTNDGGFIIGGTEYALNTGGAEAMLIKTDSTGNLLWTKLYGGTNDDFGYFVRQTADGGYIICGSTKTYGAGLFDAYLIKTDSNGDTLWTKTFGSTDWEIAYCVYPVSGGYIMFCQQASTNFYTLVIKTDTVGNIIWSKKYRITQEAAYFGNITSDGGFIITGKSGTGIGTSDAYLIKTDSAGIIQWDKTYNTSGGSAVPSFVSQTSDGGYIVGGYLNGGGAGLYDAHVIKTDSNGTLLWASAYGIEDNEVCYSIAETIDGGYLVCGSWDENFIANGNSDAYLFKIDSGGESGCNQTTILTTEQSPPVTSELVSLSTSYGGQVSAPLLPVSQLDTMITLCPQSININGINSEKYNLHLFPNPATSELRIENAELRIKEVEMFDVFGKCVYKSAFDIHHSALSIDVSSLVPGIYFVRLANEKEQVVRKVVVQH